MARGSGQARCRPIKPRYIGPGAFLSPQQKRLLFIGLPLFGSLAYAAFFIFDRMNYAPLYTNLSLQDGAAVVKELEASKIPYALSGGGTVIEVPRGVIYLIGTLIGMVLLLRNLSGQDTQSLPSALGLAVLTTLYGAVLANVVVAPLAARLHSISVEREMQMRLIVDWIMMICRGESTAAIASKLGVVLPPSKTGVSRGRSWSPIALST